MKSILELPKKEKIEEEKSSFEVFKIPFVLEKYNNRLWIVYIDNLLEVILKLPFDFLILLLNYIATGKISRTEYHIVTHFLMVCIPFLILSDNIYIFDLKEWFNTSYLYHGLRG